MWKKSYFQFITTIILTACSAMPGARETRNATTATSVAASWTKTPTTTAISTATSTPTPSSTPTLTLTPTITPDIKQTQAEATQKAISATQTMAVVKLEQVQEQALSVCQGNVLAAAPDWNQSMGEVNSSVICTKGSCKTPSDYFSDENITKWDPKDASDLQLVICAEWETTILQTCYYYPGHIAVNRVREKVIFTIYAAQSGKTVGRFSVTGGMPEYCPQTTFLNPVFPASFGGDKPDIGAIFQKLNSFMHIPAQ